MGHLVCFYAHEIWKVAKAHNWPHITVPYGPEATLSWEGEQEWVREIDRRSLAGLVTLRQAMEAAGLPVAD